MKKFCPKDNAKVLNKFCEMLASIQPKKIKKVVQVLSDIKYVKRGKVRGE
jgi:hypothetical protein